jgi:hypothetical protein
MGEAKRKSLIPPGFTVGPTEEYIADQILSFEQRLHDHGFIEGTPYSRETTGEPSALTDDGVVVLAVLFTNAMAGWVVDGGLNERDERMIDRCGRVLMQAARLVIEKRLPVEDGQHRG